MPLAGRVPRRAPAPPGTPGHPDPGRSRTPPRTTARFGWIAGDPGGRPRLHRGRGESHARPLRHRSRPRLLRSGLMQSTEAGLRGCTRVLVLDWSLLPDALVRAFSDGNRYTGDYLTEEVLNRHSDEVRSSSWRCRCSTASRPLCATTYAVPRGQPPSCATSGAPTSSSSLPGRRRVTVPLPSLARGSGRAASRDSRPRQEASTLARAPADWFTGDGHVDEAVKHLIAAGDTTCCGATGPAPYRPQFVDAGRIATVLGLFRAIGTADDPAEPAASVTSAWLAALARRRSSLAAAMSALDAHPDLVAAGRDHAPGACATATIDSLFGDGGRQRMLQAAACCRARRRPSLTVSTPRSSRSGTPTTSQETWTVPLRWRTPGRPTRPPSSSRSSAWPPRITVEDERGRLAAAGTRGDGDGRPRGTWTRSVAAGLDGPHRRSAAQAGGRPGWMWPAATLARGLELRRETSAHGPWGMKPTHLLVHALVAAEAGLTCGEDPPRRAQSAHGTLRRRDGRRAAPDGMRTPNHPVQGRGSWSRAAATVRETEILRLLQGPTTLTEIGGELYLSARQHATPRTLVPSTASSASTHAPRWSWQGVSRVLV